ncbi:MAG: hypothetical protein IJF11_02855 [Clostridia bacterium]|nr:hypothetical protein [Clostridia bacterium]
MEFKNKVFEHLENYKRDVLGTTRCGCFRGIEYGHILCDQERLMAFSLIPSDAYKVEGSVLFFTKIKHEPIKLHTNWYHLNSSQILCISYFYRLIENSALLRAFCEKYSFGEPIGAEFEYITEDGTNVDFAIHLKDGGHIFFEIKYTENDFGSASLYRKGLSFDEVLSVYRDRYKKFYSKVKISEDSYLKHYQVVRNVSLSPCDAKSTTVFLIPKCNTGAYNGLWNGLNAIENKDDFRYFVFYWEELLKGDFDALGVFKKYFNF